MLNHHSRAESSAVVNVTNARNRPTLEVYGGLPASQLCRPSAPIPMASMGGRGVCALNEDVRVTRARIFDQNPLDSGVALSERSLEWHVNRARLLPARLIAG